MEKQKTDTDKSLGAWIAFQSLIIIIAAIFAYLVVELGGNIMFHDNRDINIGRVLGLLLPMCAILGALNHYLIKATYKYFSALTNGIEKVASGDFSARLDDKKSGPFSDVYKNFNKMGEELQNVHMLRNDFINSYSHEFKTPITSINGFANLLLETNVTDEERDRYLQIIADESARLADLANSTILLSKLDSQQIVEEKKPYALDEQLRQCAIMLSAVWNKKSISFSTELDDVTYNGNAQLMQHLWLNLLSNAIKYTPEHGEISINLTQKSNKVIVQIADTGIGMSEETAAHIFDKYYQAEVFEKRHGLGLGLSIVKRIIDICDGTIDVCSRINEGSTFIVTLPL